MAEESFSSRINRELKAPFHPRDIEWRVAQSGEKNGRYWLKCFAYVDNRAIMQRLDDVVGAMNWRTEITQLRPVTRYSKQDSREEGGFLTTIYIRDPETGEWVGKTDGANNTDFEPIKGGMSGATKRAAVSWGIGRYLYDLPEGWGIIHDHGILNGQLGSGGSKKWLNWSPPALPHFALPDTDMGFPQIMDFIKTHYDPKKHGDKYVPFGADVLTLKELMRRVKDVWGKDYYLTLYIYEGLKNLVS